MSLTDTAQAAGTSKGHLSHVECGRDRPSRELVNSGTVPWTGRWLRRLGPPAGLGIPTSPLQVAIATTMPGQTVDISVPLRAHAHPGTAEVHWKMVDGDGHEFFPDRYPEGIFTTVIVRDGAPKPEIRRLALSGLGWLGARAGVSEIPQKISGRLPEPRRGPALGYLDGDGTDDDDAADDRGDGRALKAGQPDP